MSRDFHLPGRSPVLAQEGMAATSHPLATLAAIDILRAGGTAADAAIAAVATLCVVEPAMTGIGGDCFCLIGEPGKPVWGYNGSGRAGAAGTTEKMLPLGGRQIPAEAPQCRTGPGRSPRSPNARATPLRRRPACSAAMRPPRARSCAFRRLPRR